jgi:FkbM family methyltransferase
MKSFKEFNFLLRECGLFIALFYLSYKLRLKLLRSTWLERRNRSKDRRLEKIYSALSLYQHENVVLDGQRYIRSGKLNGLPYSVYLRPYSSDQKVFFQIFEREEYNSVIEIYNQLFRVPPSNIIDCGSNIGLATLYFNKHYPNAKFSAIEPFSDNSRLMRLNFESAGMNNYDILEGGIWNKDTTLYINRQFRDQKEWSVSLSEAPSPGDDKKIPAYSLLGLINRQQDAVDILKIDVEGAETLLFDDPEYSAAFLNRVKCLAIEIHDEFNCRNKIYNALVANNFFYFNTNELTLAINRSFL